MVNVSPDIEGEELVMWYLSAKIGYRHLTIEMDDFISFAGPDLWEYASTPLNMRHGLVRFFNDRLGTAVAKVVVVCTRREPNAENVMHYARLLYFVSEVDREAVDLDSVRQLSRAYTRLRNYEARMNESDEREWKERVYAAMVSMRNDMVEARMVRDEM